MFIGDSGGFPTSPVMSDLSDEASASQQKDSNAPTSAVSSPSSRSSIPSKFTEDVAIMARSLTEYFQSQRLAYELVSVKS